MKKLIALSFVTAALAFQFPQQQPKEINLRLTPDEVSLIYSVVDNASLSGEIRKPLLLKIQSQFVQQMKVDTTAAKHKK
jgi:hypothetical protein